MTQIRIECWALQCDQCGQTFFHGVDRPELPRASRAGWHVSKCVPVHDLCPDCNEATR